MSEVCETKMSEEKKLRKCDHLAGSWVLLGDGQKWCISALPLGKAGDEILNALEAVFAVQDTPLSFDMGIKEEEGSEKTVEELLNEARERTKAIMKRSRTNIKTSCDFTFALLRVNYPALTREYFDEQSLVTLQHASLFQRIAQGGTKLGEILGEAEPGEAKTATTA